MPVWYKDYMELVLAWELPLNYLKVIKNQINPEITVHFPLNFAPNSGL